METEKLLPEHAGPDRPSGPSAVFGTNPPPPTERQQSWGVLISIFVIVLMIVLGAFYSWGKRIAEERALLEASQRAASSSDLRL